VTEWNPFGIGGMAFDFFRKEDFFLAFVGSVSDI